MLLRNEDASVGRQVDLFHCVVSHRGPGGVPQGSLESFGVGKRLLHSNLNSQIVLTNAQYL